jgi:hypothetical protein
MKSRLFVIFNVFIIAALALGMVISPVTARQPQLALVRTPKLYEYLLLLPMPSIEQMRAFAGISAEQVEMLAYKLLYRQAEPMLSTLYHLQREGKISRFELQPDKFAIAVWSEAGSRELGPELSGLQHSSSSTACGQSNARALNEMLRGISRSEMRRLNQVQSHASIQATDPSIEAYYQTGTDWSEIEGQTASNTPVSMRILRNGAQIVSDSTTSDNGGWYYFYPDWGSGCNQGYDWLLQEGDVVEVTANGNTVSMVVSHLEANVDPFTHMVTGQVDANLQVKVELWWSATDFCDYDDFDVTVNADASGFFSADYTSLAAFDGRAWTDIYALDSNGNSTIGYYDAYNIANSFSNPGRIYGDISPSTNFTAQLVRGGSTLQTISGTSEYDGYFSANFSQDIQAGDVVQLNFNAVSLASSPTATSLSFTVPPVEAILDAATDQLSGTTSPSHTIEVGFWKRDWGSVMTTCDYDWDCNTTSSDGAGAFSAHAGWDILPGDSVSMYIYDSQGDYFYYSLSALALAADLSWNEAQGYWQTPGESILVQLFDSSHTLKDSSTTKASSYDGGFYAYFSTDIQPGDILEVGNGTFTGTMTVQDLTALLDKDADTLSGNIEMLGIDSDAQNGEVNASGFLVADYSNDEPSINEWNSACFEPAITGGAYSIDLSTWDVESQDDADVYYAGPDGGYTFRRAYPLGVMVYLDGWDDIGGTAMEPGSLVTAKLYDGATLLETNTDNAYSDGYYYMYFSTPLDPGLKVEVSASGQSVNVVIPTITVMANTSTNSLYGKSPANENITLEMDNYFHCYASNGWCYVYFYLDTTADASGNYNVSLAGVSGYDYYTGTCHDADASAPCSDFSASYYQLDENGVWYDLPLPDDGPDAYESDNSPAEAVPYSGASVHTFNTTEDEDWIALTITAADVGKQYILRTINLGRNADTYLELYDTDGTTLLASDDDSGFGRSDVIFYTFPTTGTYYVRVTPNYEYYSVRCGSGYTFVATSNVTVLPITAR